jgi:uncharacterized membrane protein
MLALLGSIFSGGLTGLLGVGVQRFFDHLKGKQELERLRLQHEHEREMRREDREMLQAEFAGRVKVAEVEAAGREAAADAAAFSASFATEPQRYAVGARPEGAIGAVGWLLMILLDLLRGIVRPALTLYLCAITTILYLDAKGILAKYGAALPVKDAVDLVNTIVSTVLYLTTTCVLWWFGTRNKARPPAT